MAARTFMQNSLFDDDVVVGQDSKHTYILPATYNSTGIAEYDNNPLITALPPIYSAEQWVERLVQKPVYNPCERDLPDHIRFQKIFKLLRLFVPLPRHANLACRVDALIRTGYAYDRKGANERAQNALELYERVQRGEIVNGSFNDVKPVITSSIVGMSGMGKTTSMSHILGTYPQAIYHRREALHQVVWMSISCRKDEDVDDLARGIVRQFDNILGTEHQEEITRDMSPLDKALSLINVYSLGLLVVENIQNLVPKRQDGRDYILNYLHELCDIAGVPIIFSGNMKALRLFKREFAPGRRASGQGLTSWSRLSRHEWKYMIDVLWQYQWVRNVPKITDELSEWLYKETNGIPSVLIASFILAQLRAIWYKKEVLSEAVFDNVFKNDLKPIRPMLKALQSNDILRIEQYEDIHPLDFEELLAKEQLRYKTVAHPKRTEHVASTDVRIKAIGVLQQMGYTYYTASNAIEQCYESNGNSYRMLVAGALDLLISMESCAVPQELKKEQHDTEAANVCGERASEMRMSGVCEQDGDIDE